MSILEAIVLGAIQGATEFIPISSSGHLVIAQYLMSGASEHLFLEWINIGTVLALMVYFRQRIIGIIKDIFVNKKYHLALAIIIAMIPAGLIGFLFSDMIEKSSFFGSVWVVAVTLAVVGVLLVILEKIAPKISEKLEKLPFGKALAIGLAQVLALIPGTSRSGSTIIAGRLSGLSRSDAAEFSFLVSIPIMLGVILKLVVKSSDRGYFIDNALPLVFGNVAAFVVGLLAVGFLMKFLRDKSLAVFGWYRIALAIVLVILLSVKI